MRRLFFLCVVLTVCALAMPVWATAPAIGQQPLNRTVTENDPVSFFVGGVTGDAPLVFLWHRNGTIISNAPNGPVYSIPFAALADNGSGYSVIITNSSGSATSTVATLTVNPDVTAPTILNVTNSPDRLRVIVVFSERVEQNSAQDIFNYSIPGANIIGATLDPSGSNVTLTVDSALVAGAAYSVFVDNVADLAANTIAVGTHFDFRAGNPPLITIQPGNRTVTENQPVSFFVGGVTGDAPLVFLWHRNGTIISNAPNAPSYSIPFAPLADNGSGFSVIITNSSGSATSAVATLTVNADVTQPTIRLVTNAPSYIHIVVVFSERVEQNSAQDIFNYSIPGANITGATLDPSGSNVTLTVDSALTDGAVYTVNVAGVTDVAASPNSIAPGTFFNFRAGRPPLITLQPENQVVNPGASASFTVIATGTELEHQWYRGLNKLADETNATLTLPSVTPAMLGSYRVVIANFLGSITSAAATLSFFSNYAVDLPPGYSFVTKQLANNSPQFPVPPSDMTLFKWIPAAQNFAVYNFAAGAGWNPSEPVVDVGEGVIIQTAVPASLVFTGTRIVPSLPVSLSPGFNLRGAQIPIVAGYADIVGSPQEGTLVYQYRPGGDLAPFNETNYHNNFFIYGQWRDQPPRLRVGEAAWIRLGSPVVITNQPVALTNVNIGQSFSFTVGAMGEEPIRYQWRLNGQDIPNATNANYSMNSASPSNAGIYSVTVGNVLGDLNSASVPLKLNVAPFALTDDFADAGNVNDANRLLASHNRNATTQPGEPQHAGKRTRSSVWLNWTAPTGGIVSMSSIGSGFDSVLAVYTGPSVSNLHLLDADDDGGGYGGARVRFNARVGNVYRICVSGLGDSQGDILLGWNLEPTAQFLPEFGTQPRDLTAGYGGSAQFSAAVTNGFVSYQWFFNGAPLTNNSSATTATLTITNIGDQHVGRYFVRASNQSRSRDSRRVELQLQDPGPVEAIDGLMFVDKLLDLEAIPGSGVPLKRPDQKFGTVHHGYSKSNPGSTVGAYARDVGEPNHCGIAGGSTVWFAIQAEATGQLYVNTDGSSYNTLLAAYIGPGDSYVTLTNVGCDNNSGLDGLDSRMNFPVLTNNYYYIAAGGVGAAFGTLKWKFQLVRPLTITNIAYTNISGGRVTMKINNTPGLTALVQSATNLVSPFWITNFTSTNAVFNYTNNNVGATNRFYRAVNIF